VSDDPAFYDRAFARIDRISIVLAILAVAAMYIRLGWRGALGCAIGAVLSWFSFRLWKRLANSIGAPGAGSPASATFLGLRYLLLGGIVFVIISYLEVSLLAVLAGLFVSVAAILVEIAYELITTTYKT
jgi:hypothetical protein